MYEHLQDIENVIQETAALIEKIAFSKIKKEFKGKGGKMTASYEIDSSHPECFRLIENLNFLYFVKGMGFKLLSSSLGNISYTRLRTVFSHLGIERRTGHSCVTDGLKKIRSERAKKNNPWTDWTQKYKDKDAVNKHHLGGWYFNKSKEKFVWLRSSWEFGYAKWLDERLVDWDVECRSYLLSDGKYYRPDFFIFERNKLSKIVEIKSTWSNGAMDRIDKFEKFRKEYPEINSELVTNDLFSLINCSQKSIINMWKKQRILELSNV
jgi:hypothetical protein